MDNECQRTEALDIMEKIIGKLQQNNRKCFVKFLEILLGYNNDSAEISALKREVTVMFFNILQNVGFERFMTEIWEDFDNIFLPKELKRITVTTANINRFYEFARGSCGILWFGSLTQSDGSQRHVAIKVVKEETKNNILLKEAKVMARLEHKNVVKLLAFHKVPMMLVMEYMKWGSLNEAVHECQFTEYDILKALFDIASGMEYISNKKYVHRDLASRNIFVDRTKACKIGDFGYALYFGHSPDGQVSGKTNILINLETAPESMKSQIFSVKSDVWSFGILVWELYQSLEVTICVIDIMLMVRALNSSKHLPFIRRCPLDVYFYLRNRILNLDPTMRPDFTDIKEKIADVLAS